jgi:hypothetical protein
MCLCAPGEILSACGVSRQRGFRVSAPDFFCRVKRVNLGAPREILPACGVSCEQGRLQGEGCHDSASLERLISMGGEQQPELCTLPRPPLATGSSTIFPDHT